MDRKHQATEVLKSELGGGERLLWTGMPSRRLRLRRADFVLVPVSVLSGGFALFWGTQVLSLPHAPVFFKTLAVVFLLLGFHVIGGRFIFDSLMRAATFYGVTDQRVIIARGWLNRDVRTYPVRILGDVSLDEAGNGSGSIAFDTTNPDAWSRNAWSALSGKFVPQFELIDGARGVYELIREHQSRELAQRRSS